MYLYWQLGPLAEGTQVVVPYRDTRPAILDRSLGEGRVLTGTTPVSDSPNNDPWNLIPVGDPDLPAHGRDAHWNGNAVRHRFVAYVSSVSDWTDCGAVDSSRVRKLPCTLTVTFISSFLHSSPSTSSR